MYNYMIHFFFGKALLLVVVKETVSLCGFGLHGTHYVAQGGFAFELTVAQASLELEVFLFNPPSSWVADMWHLQLFEGGYCPFFFSSFFFFALGVILL